MQLRVMHAIVIVLACSSCLEIDDVRCADGRICPQGSRCDDTKNRCISPDQIVACDGQADGSACELAGAPGTCSNGICEVAYCGNGVREVGEQCDGEDLGTADCTTAGFYYAPGLACSAFCTFNVAACTGTCGDDVIDPGELCDGNAPAGLACLDFGYDAGSIGCAPGLCIPQLATCARFGWTRVVTPTSNQLTALWASSPRDVWAVGVMGTVIHYDGHVWTSPQFSTANPFYAVTGTGPNDVFIAGYEADVHHWDGANWSVTNDVTGFNPIHGLTAVAPNDVYAVAEAGKVAHYNGTSWTTTVPAPATSYLQAVWARNATDIWAVGYNTGPLAPLAMHYDGQSWSPVTTSATGSTLFYGVTGVDPANVYVMSTTFTELVGGVWRQTSSFFGNLTGTATALGVAVASTYDHFYWLLPDMITWAQEEQQGLPILRTVGGDRAGHLWSAGDNGAMYEYHGASWLAFNSNGFSSNVVGLWQADPTHLIAVGSGGQAAVWDGGKFGTPTAVAQFGLSAVWGTSFTNVYAVGPMGVISHSDGNAWSPQTSGTTSALTAVFGSGPTDIYAVGAGGAITHSNGSTWTVVTSPTTQQLNGVYTSDPEHVFAVGNAGQVVSFDGTTWRVSTIADGANLRAVWGTSATNVWTIGTGGVIWHYDGTAWSAAESPTKIGLVSMWGTGPRDIFAAGDANTVVHFDGVRWSQVRFPIINNGPFDTIRAIGGDGRRVYFSTDFIRHQLLRLAFPATCEASETACTDALDDDCDFLVDCDDPDCRPAAACAP